MIPLPYLSRISYASKLLNRILQHILNSSYLSCWIGNLKTKIINIYVILYACLPLGISFFRSLLLVFLWVMLINRLGIEKITWLALHHFDTSSCSVYCRQWLICPNNLWLVCCKVRTRSLAQARVIINILPLCFSQSVFRRAFRFSFYGCIWMRPASTSQMRVRQMQTWVYANRE